MIIDLTRRVIQVQLSRMISGVVFILVEFTLLFLLKFDWGFFSSKTLITILLILFIIYKVVERILDLNYIYYSDSENKIIFRYFSMSYFSKQKNSIEINKTQFGGYTLHKSLFGYKKVISLIHVIGDKTASYKPISISSLNNTEFEGLIESLDKIPVVEAKHEG